MPAQTTLLALLAVLTPQDGDAVFCDTLKRVIAATPGNFETLGLRGRVDDPGLDTDVQLRYGSLECDVMTDFPGLDGKHVYNCISREPTEVQSGDGRVLADQMGKCLGMRIDERISQADMPYYVANSEAASVVISFDIVLPRGVSERGPGEVLYLSLRVYPPDS